MRFWATKEEEILSRMHAVLEKRGYLQVDDGDRNERWRHPELGVTVDLGYTASYYDPIYAAVSHLVPVNCKAWNAKGLSIHLDTAEAEAQRQLDSLRAWVRALTHRPDPGKATFKREID